MPRKMAPLTEASNDSSRVDHRTWGSGTVKTARDRQREETLSTETATGMHIQAWNARKNGSGG